MSVVERILKDVEFFVDTADMPKKGVEQHKKPECFKAATIQ